APLRPSVAEYSVLAASLLLTVTAVLFATLGGRAPREVVALGEALEDAAAFPELARALPLSDVQVAEQVQNVQTRKTVRELVESLQGAAGGTSNLEPQQQRVYVLEMTRDPRPPVAEAAVRAVAHFESDAAEAVLREAVVHPSQSVRRAAVEVA